MSNIFEVIDKTGRKIRLTKEQFEHVICHKGMKNYIEEMNNPIAASCGVSDEFKNS